MLLANNPQGTKTFEKWSREITEVAKMIDYQDYDWKQAAVDAMILQTTNAKLRERALQENITFDKLMNMGIVKEQSSIGAGLLEKASGQCSSQIKYETEVRRLQTENKKLKAKFGTKHKNKACFRCNKEDCPRGSKCPANGKLCSYCNKMNHFASACRFAQSKKTGNSKNRTFGQISSAENTDSEESSGRIVVGKIGSNNIQAEISVNDLDAISLATDTGISKTLLNSADWRKVRHTCKFVKTSKRFRPYGTAYHLPIKGKAQVTLTAERGASIITWAYVCDDENEQSLLGEGDAIRLGIVSLDTKGATEEVVQMLAPVRKSKSSSLSDLVSGGQTQQEIDIEMEEIKREFPSVFTDKTGKFTGKPISIQIREGAVPIIQPRRRIPLQYNDRLKKQIEKMLQEDIIEGPIEVEEPGTFVSNLVITDNKNDSDRIRVTLDCQAVNREIYATHEPIPTSEELRHKLKGSDRFSSIDMTNCYHQFEIEPTARKLFAFHTQGGIFKFKRMVMGSTASSEIQKRVRETLKHCQNTIHIKDDILVHGKGREHDIYLRKLLHTLQVNGLTVRPAKCNLGKTEVKWFGNIFSKDGMSPDPAKCTIIKQWPSPKSKDEVKSFLQTVQFNAKFMRGSNGSKSYPELTQPLRSLAKKNVRFSWGLEQEQSFKELKDRLCSDNVMAPYDTGKDTRLYVDSSPVGTQSTVAQKHIVEGEEIWKPVNHTSRAWTPTEARYSQIERESNGILTGMHMNKMFTLGTHVEVVNDHKPLISLYGATKTHTTHQPRVDRHRTKLLAFDYHVVYESGKKTPCDYGSRHPPNCSDLSEKELMDWCVEKDTDIFVNRIVADEVPCAIPFNLLQKETKDDPVLSNLIEDITIHMRCRKQLHQYKGIFSELSVTNGVVVRGRQMVIPASLQADVIGLAHEGHMGTDKTVKLLRETVWFPKMTAMVRNFVLSCTPCNAALPATKPVPLQPNILPQRPWQKVHADYKGPIGGKYYMHVLIDQYSKFPEVDITSSTSFRKLEPILDRVFSTHGIPEELTSDNGSPYFSHDMKQYAKKMGIKLTPVSPYDPQSNGFAENFVKILVKMIHAFIADGKDPQKEMSNFLLQYRAAPHTTTEKSPAEMLFQRKIRTKLPFSFNQDEETVSQKQTRKLHDEKKNKQKEYFDKHHGAKTKDIKVGDSVLIAQQKSTINPPFDPKPYIVSDVKGNKITSRRDAQIKIRDKNKLKVLSARRKELQPSWEKSTISPVHDYNSFDIEFEINVEAAAGSNAQSADDGNSSKHTDELVSMDAVSHQSSQEGHGLDADAPSLDGPTTHIPEDIAPVRHMPSQLFVSDDGMEMQMETLLANARVRTEKRVTRSEGLHMEWNPTMNDAQVVICDDLHNHP